MGACSVELCWTEKYRCDSDGESNDASSRKHNIRTIPWQKLHVMRRQRRQSVVFAFGKKQGLSVRLMTAIFGTRVRSDEYLLSGAMLCCKIRRELVRDFHGKSRKRAVK